MPESHTVEHAAELLTFLCARRPEVKRTRVRQWLKHGSIQVNGRLVTRATHPLQTGDVVSIRAKGEVRRDRRLPPGMTILFEDASLMVIEKPENLLSMASALERDKTAYAFLTDWVRGGNPQSSERVWIVHRLDRETSGLMVFAKTKAAKRGPASPVGQDRQTLPRRGGRTSRRLTAACCVHTLDESSPFKVHSAPPSKRTRHAVDPLPSGQARRDWRVD